MKPVAPKDTPDVGGGIGDPWYKPQPVPLPAPPYNPFDPLVNDPNNPNPDLT